MPRLCFGGLHPPYNRQTGLLGRALGVGPAAIGMESTIEIYGHNPRVSGRHSLASFRFIWRTSIQEEDRVMPPSMGFNSSGLSRDFVQKKSGKEYDLWLGTTHLFFAYDSRWESSLAAGGGPSTSDRTDLGHGPGRA